MNQTKQLQDESHYKTLIYCKAKTYKDRGIKSCT